MCRWDTDTVVVKSRLGTFQFKCYTCYELIYESFEYGFKKVGNRDDDYFKYSMGYSMTTRRCACYRFGNREPQIRLPRETDDM